MGALLQMIGKSSDQQVAAETHRRSSAMKLTPGKPQLLCRSIDQAGNFGFEIAHTRLFVCNRFDYCPDPERAVARQRAGERTHRGLWASWARRLGDTVDPTPLLFGRRKRQPKLLLQGAREDAAHGMTLPPGGTSYLIDRCALGSTQHRDHLLLLRRTLRV